MELLSREAFHRSVFARDKGRCVVCGAPAVDAHHLIERRLFDDGGYYLDNGVALCASDHLRAEQTLLSVEDLRAAAGIETVLLPEHFEPEQAYDKWGNPLLSGGLRMRGELFFEEGVQKILAPLLSLFTPYVKAPRVFHLPWSPGVGQDDKVQYDLSAFMGQECVATLKMDGENTSCYPGHLHARSLDSLDHESQHWVKAFHASWRFELPDQWRVQGENLYARHSISYRGLGTYFFGFHLWNERNFCLGWDDTAEWFQLLGITPVPVLWRGVFDENVLRHLHRETFEGNPCEGFVVRVARSFAYGEYRRVVAKFVRAGHVQTGTHWKHGPVVKNGL